MLFSVFWKKGRNVAESSHRNVPLYVNIYHKKTGKEGITVGFVMR